MFYNGIKEFDLIKKDTGSVFAGKPDLIVFCVDFDGTLVKICKNPLDVYIPASMQNFLNKTTRIKNVIMCIVTGRELEDIKKRVNINKNIIYSGNHGFQIKSYYDNFKLDFLIEDAEKYIPLLEDALRELYEFQKFCLKNLIIENKKFSVSLHYRLLNAEETKILKETANNLITKNPEFKKYLHITRGKKIIEIRPKVNWNKGYACDYIVKKFSKTIESRSNKKINILRVNMGDDITDETMFTASYKIKTTPDAANIDVKMVNCVIGKKKSLADIYLESYKYTPIFIKNILSVFNEIRG